MIRHILLCLTLMTFSAEASAFSFADRGVGLAVGEPGGITLFYRDSEKSFIQAFIGPGLMAGVDYNFAFAGALKSATNVTPYLGLGGFLFTGDHWSAPHNVSGFGLRMPAGLLIQIPEAPFHFHLEVAAASTISPFMYSFAAIMAGVRFLF